ncbi:MAG: D-alanine--D-alanine ligase family protein [Minisyncoccota bacterium]
MRIAVLRGGPSKHYDSSLKSGEFVLSHLRKEPQNYRPIDVFISKDGAWHVRGMREEPHQVLRHVDLVWNALHGEYGEDGVLGKLLSNLNVPHTGSTTFGLAISSNKDLTKKIYEQHGLLTPKHETLLGHVSMDELVRIFRTYLHPVIIKPAKGRGPTGVKKAYSFQELQDAVAEAFRYSERVLIEECINGIEASCGVIEGFRKDKLYALIPMPNDPSYQQVGLSSGIHKQIEAMSQLAHNALALRHYSSSNFVVTPKGRVYILETNALPDVSPETKIHKSLSSVGITDGEFINHIISIAK